MKFKRQPTFRADVSGQMRIQWQAKGRCTGCGKTPVVDPPYMCASCLFDTRRHRPKTDAKQLTIADDIPAEAARLKGE